MLLYTDGLIERRRRPLNDGMKFAGQVVRKGRDMSLDDLATHIMTQLASGDGYDDDVAVLLYRHPGPLEVTFPADPGQLALIRGALRRWLETCGVPADTAQGVLVAVGEACANAIEHGHRDNPGGPIRLRAEASVDELHRTVADSGRWKTPEPSPYRGRGMNLMRAMTQQVTFTPGPAGTTVDMHARIAT